MTTESIKSKIAALLAKAESTDNAFEADAFMAKVNELLERHQIEMHEVRQAQKTETDPMGHQKGETNLYASILWARNLAGSLAQYYGCRLVYWRRGNHFIYEVTGRESARTTFELMLPFVISQVKVQARKLQSSVPSSRTLSVWEREVGQALWSRVSKLANQANKERNVLVGKGLIPVDDVDAYFKAQYTNLKEAREQTLRYSSAAREAAARVSLNVQATGRHVKLLA